MITLAAPALCNGCSACSAVCPNGCIEFVRDSRGFLYPEILPEKCLECHVCEKTCPVLNPRSAKPSFCRVLAVKNKNDEERMAGSSGGFFPALARRFVEEGGIVFGAAWMSGWLVHHQSASMQEDIAAFFGSKYLPSELGDAFRQVKVLLEQDRKVLFSGTPCQIAGLSAFLRRPYHNLLTVEVICMGVPAPRLFQRHLKELEKQFLTGEHPEITEICFRDKSTSGGWKNYHISMWGKKSVAQEPFCFYRKPHRQDAFFRLYLQSLVLRDSCHECRIKQIASTADFTVGDAWGINEILSNFDDNQGASFVCIRTRAGEEWLEKLREKLDCREIAYQQVCERNPSLIRSVPCSPRRKEFDACVDSLSIRELAEKFTKPSWKVSILRKLAGLRERIHAITKTGNI